MKREIIIGAVVAALALVGYLVWHSVYNAPAVNAQNETPAASAQKETPAANTQQPTTPPQQGTQNATPPAEAQKQP